MTSTWSRGHLAVQHEYGPWKMKDGGMVGEFKGHADEVSSVFDQAFGYIGHITSQMLMCTV